MDPSTSYVASNYFADFGLVLFALFLVLLNGFFVAAEFAIVKLRATKVDALAEKNGWRGHILRTVHNQLDAYLSACQLGITLASLGLGWVGEPAFAHLLEPLLAGIGIESPKLIHGIAFFTAFFIISYLHIVVGELAPKSWAIRKPELLSLWTAAPLYMFYWAMYPAIFLLNASANAILRVAGQGEPGPHHEHHYSRDELKLILHSSRASDPSDQDMRVLASAVEMGELEVVDWANSREDLVSLPLTAALDEVFSVFRRHKYSRYPIYDDNSGEYVGVLHIKDLLLHLSLLEMLPSALKAAKNPMIIIGQGALSGPDGKAVLANAAKLAADVGAVTDEWNGFCVLHTAASRVGALDLGFVPGEGAVAAGQMLSSLDVVFLLGADELDFSAKTAKCVVYIGSHGDNGAHYADVILPGATYTEKSGTWVNTEGRVQMGNRAGFAPGEAREDWAILRALSDVLGKKLPFDSLSQLRIKLYEAYPHFAEIDEIAPGSSADIAALAKKPGKMGKSLFASPVKDFYLTNPIARASAVMAECSALARNNFKAAAE